MTAQWKTFFSMRLKSLKLYLACLPSAEAYSNDKPTAKENQTAMPEKPRRVALKLW